MTPAGRNLTHSGKRDVGSRTGAARPHGVLLINLGTPDGPDPRSVRRYLAEFLSDPDVISLPRGMGWFNVPLGHLIARFRAKGSAEMYERIWTERGSPLRTISADQVAALQGMLPKDWRVFYGMRYGRPAIKEALAEAVQAGVQELVVIPMYPQYSGPTTGTALRILHQELATCGHCMNARIVTEWYDDTQYIHAQAGRIAEYATRQGLSPEDTYLLFSAHGLPTSYVEKGDPYPEHVRRSVELVCEELAWPAARRSLAYQSRFGPVRWLEPFTDHALAALAEAGERKILVCPISFTADCLETLEEIDLRYRELTAERGAELYVTPALNTYGPFMECLRHLVLRGPRPLSASARASGRHVIHTSDAAAVERAAADEFDLGTLLMVGVTLPGRLGAGEGPALAYCGPDGFRQVKRSQCDVPDLLRSIMGKGHLREAWVWNTCQRFELYGRLEGGVEPSERERTVAEVQSTLFNGDGPGDDAVNVLHGRAVVHHMLRTAAGLNSPLPGERDISGQLSASQRLASRAGTAGPALRWLAGYLRDGVQRLRSETRWGGLDPEYTYAALDRLATTGKFRPADAQVVVIGGSTTSAAALHTLRERFGVPGGRLVLFYRGHRQGGQVKMLRKAIGQGRRVRVHSYAEDSVIRAIADADVVLFGLDSREPVLEAGHIADLRDWEQRPLTVIDFNMFGSTAGWEKVAGVTLFDAAALESEVALFADCLCASPEFNEARAEAEAWIIRHLGSLKDETQRGTEEAASVEAGGTGNGRVAPTSRAEGRPGGGRDEPSDGAWGRLRIGEGAVR